MADNIGRPTVMTDEVLRKLAEAFAWGCTDTEACCYADISTTALYEYQNKHPEYAEYKARLKDTPVLKARARLMQDINSKQEWIANSTSRYMVDKRDGKATQVVREEVDIKVVVKDYSTDDAQPDTEPEPEQCE